MDMADCHMTSMASLSNLPSSPEIASPSPSSIGLYCTNHFDDDVFRFLDQNPMDYFENSPPSINHQLSLPDSYQYQPGLIQFSDHIAATNTIVDHGFQSWHPSPLPPSTSFPWNGSTNTLANDGIHTSTTALLDSWSSLNESDSLVTQFQKGLEEGNKFLPRYDNFLLLLDSNKNKNNALKTSSKQRDDHALNRPAEVEPHEREWSYATSNGRKNDRTSSEERIQKQPATCDNEDEDGISQLFDKIFLKEERINMPLVRICSRNAVIDHVVNVTDAARPEPNRAKKGRKSRRKKEEKEIGEKKEKKEVDLNNLLLQCARDVAADDYGNAHKVLQDVRKHSSPFGIASQRIAHYFANGLEARLAGTGAEIYSGVAYKWPSASDLLKAYETFLSVCPLRTIPSLFATQIIINVAEKATTLHIIDFGILYGFQWPTVIQHLSTRPGGPPKLRITGIELPQPGFRPAEVVEQARRRVEKYCQRFNVPFEFQGIAQKWETIRIKDLKIERSEGEIVIVNSMYRFDKLPNDDAKDVVLNLIRDINPDCFIHAIINGSYGTPLFYRRFKHALFHYSTIVDMFESVLGEKNEERLLFENALLGVDAFNVIACEGSQRHVIPENYRQWRFRTVRAGFTLLPLQKKHFETLKCKMEGYHKEFGIEDDGDWVHLGWKGRTICAISCWVPADRNS